MKKRLFYVPVFSPGISIQSAMHDSIEDARTALKLYAKYQAMSKDGMDKVREALKDLYSKGRDLQWKVPGADNGND